jgi:diketogulonate reductase-like aldo/keto reductase
MNQASEAAVSAPRPNIIYGTAWKKADTERLVAQAIELGFRAIDTACQPKHYNEAGVGAGIAAALSQGTSKGLSRAQLFVQTKFTPLSNQDPQQLPYDPQASLAQQVAQSFECSLRNLQTSYLDSLILHSPLADEAETLTAWRAMEGLVDAGHVRQLGLSNCYSLAQFQALHAAARVKPAVLQNRFYDKTGHDRELRAFCLAQGISYQSFWTLTANPHLLAHPVMAALAEAQGRTAAQVLYRYLTQRGVVPLTGTTSAQHMREDLAIFEFALAPEALAQLDRLL